MVSTSNSPVRYIDNPSPCTVTVHWGGQYRGSIFHGRYKRILDALTALGENWEPEPEGVFFSVDVDGEEESYVVVEHDGRVYWRDGGDSGVYVHTYAGRPSPR